MQHEEKTARKDFLINKDEEKVVDYIIDKLESNIKHTKFSDYSQTCIPFYDTVLPANKKKFLAQVKMSALCEAKVANLN